MCGSAEDGKTNADTFFFSLLRSAPAIECINTPSVPSEYYSSKFEKDPKPPSKLGMRGRTLTDSYKPMIDRSKEKR